MRINAWKCDICGIEFKENDGGFKNKKMLYIHFDLGQYDGEYEIEYPDTCFDCRQLLKTKISDFIEELQQ